MLLFAVTIEPLRVSLKEHAGFPEGGKEHKVSPFADDLFIYVSDPSKSVLYKSGQISKINLNKSILFPIRMTNSQQLFDKIC